MTVTYIPFAGTLGIVRGERLPDLLNDELLTEIFAASVTHAPDRCALMSGQRHVNYQALAELSDHIAVNLGARGVLPGSYVGVWIPRSSRPSHHRGDAASCAACLRH
jgi:non-ribosomal peptide synthetase component E (peptide arylation enzyme)